MKNTDLQNAEINLGSGLKDLLSVCQGLWIETEKDEWKISKLGSKFGIALRTVEKDKNYTLPFKLNNDLTACLFIGDGEITSSLIHLNQSALYAPISGICLIILK